MTSLVIYAFRSLSGLKTTNQKPYITDCEQCDDPVNTFTLAVSS